MKRRFTQIEIMTSVGLDEAVFRRCLEQGWVRPAEGELFDDEDVARLLLIRDLIKDIGIEEESIPVILNLLDQIHILRAALRKRPAA